MRVTASRRQPAKRNHRTSSRRRLGGKAFARRSTLLTRASSSRPHFQADNAVGLIAARGQHDGEHLGARAHRAAHLQSTPSREANQPMPTNYARFLVGRHRTVAGNRQLGWLLAFVAGAINAGGFLAVQQYTSHVTGMVSAVGDNLALGHLRLVVDGIVAVLSFLLGAMCSAILVNFARRRAMASEYALPLLLEAVLILCFGLMGARLALFEGLLLPLTIVLLCFIMGLQNAVVTKLSGAVIRTTHMTGVVTDLGIELGKLVYWNADRAAQPSVRADRDRMVVLGGLLLAFLLGGVSGAFGFKHFGYEFTVPIAVLIAVIALVPTWDDFGKVR